MTLAVNLASVVTRIASEINTVRDEKANSANTLAGYGITDSYTRSQTDTAISNATSTLMITPRLTINLQTSTGNITTDPIIANALTTINSTNGYKINLGFGEYRETGPVVFNEKWQLQVEGPVAAATTAATIKNGITIQNSNGVRFTRIQVEGASSISCRAGLGHYFEKSQFFNALTLGGTGGFMMFTDCDFGGNVTISPTFAGVIYFIRCNFSGASATYTFGQSSALQVIITDSSGVPNTGFVSGSTAKAAYSGSIVYKNNTQAQFINNIPVTTHGAANNQVLKFNGVAFAPATDSLPSWTTIFSSSNTAGAKALNSSVSWNTVKSSYREVMFVGRTTGNTVGTTVVPTDLIVANYAYSTPRNDVNYVVFNGMTNLANGSFTTTFNGTVVDTIIYAR